MAAQEPDTEQLLDRLNGGDEAARAALLPRHGNRLRRLIALRLDRRLAARVDLSDVLQEALADAADKLDEYARSRPLPFYPWLRQLAWERLAQLYRRHVRAARRSVSREESLRLTLPDSSALALADRLAARDSSPGARLDQEELRGWVQAALARLGDGDREVLVLRFLEDLSTREMAAVLGVTEAGVKTRQLRALRRLRDLLDDALPKELP
jgi:RNA polymerase sigma-70 factor (ECF subfamily)